MCFSFPVKITCVMNAFSIIADSINIMSIGGILKKILLISIK